MSIRLKSVLVMAATLVVLIGALSFTLGRVMMSGFGKVEDREARQNVQRVADAIDVQLQGMESSVFTWTQWDPAYQFITDHNSQFLEENISQTLFTGMKINFCLFVDPRREIPYSGGYSLDGNHAIPVPPELTDLLQGDSVLLRNQDPTRSVRGIVNLRDASLYVVAAPITNTEGTAPARGHIVFARFLDAAEVARLSATTHLAVSVAPPTTAPDEVRVAVRDEATIAGATTLKDIDGRPALTLTVAMPRDVYREGMRSLNLLIACIIAIGVVFGAVMSLVMSRMVLGRVLDMSRQVVGMTESFDFSRQLEVTGQDEISALGHAINGMACAVSEVLAETERVA